MSSPVVAMCGKRLLVQVGQHILCAMAHLKFARFDDTMEGVPEKRDGRLVVVSVVDGCHYHGRHSDLLSG
jgi:hypothetical protein